MKELIEVVAGLIAIAGFVFGITKLDDLIPGPSPIPDPAPAITTTSVQGTSVHADPGAKRREYIKQADAVCDRWREENRKAAERLGRTREYAKEFESNFQSMLHEWAKLEPPSVDREVVDKIIAELTEANFHYGRSLVARTQEQYDQAEAEGIRLGASGTEQARAFGLRSCGSFD